MYTLYMPCQIPLERILFCTMQTFNILLFMYSLKVNSWSPVSTFPFSYRPICQSHTHMFPIGFGRNPMKTCAVCHMIYCNGHISKQACCADCRRRPSPDEAPPIGKIHPFSKRLYLLNHWMQLWCPFGFRKFLIFRRGGAGKLWEEKAESVNQLIN